MINLFYFRLNWFLAQSSLGDQQNTWLLKEDFVNLYPKSLQFNRWSHFRCFHDGPSSSHLRLSTLLAGGDIYFARATASAVNENFRNTTVHFFFFIHSRAMVERVHPAFPFSPSNTIAIVGRYFLPRVANGPRRIVVAREGSN